MLIIPEKKVPAFKQMLAAYYEGRDEDGITAFMKSDCVKSF